MKYIYYILSASFLLLSCSDDISYKEKISNYNTLYNKADSLSNVNKFSQAIFELNKAIYITDTLSKALLLRGDCYTHGKQYDNAEDDYSNVIDIEGEKSKAFKNRAINYLKQEENDDFKDDIDNYIKFHTKDTIALLLRANYYKVEEEYENAIYDYSTLINLNPNCADLYVSRGDLYKILDNKSKSISDYEKYILISGNNNKSKIYFKKALLNFSLGNFAEAIEGFNLIDTSFINFSEVLERRADSYFLSQKYDYSIRDYTEYLIVKPADSDVLYKRGEAYSLKGDKLKSYTDFQKSSLIYWKDSNVFYKYLFIIIVFSIFLLVKYFITLFSEKITDNNSSFRVYLYFIFTGIFGGHYIALKSKKRFYIFLILVLSLLTYNNYEIISFYDNIDLLLFSINYTLFNKILFFTIMSIILIDMITIPFLKNFSNYTYQKTISPDKAIMYGEELENIEKSLIAGNSDFKKLKKRYKI